MHLLSYLSLALGVIVLSTSFTPEPQQPKPAGGRYIGSKLCKNCHNGADKGNAYDHWSQTPHANAYKTLATPKAKEIAKGLGIADPQKSEKCLKCHVTAHGVGPKLVKKSLKIEDGVGCESCHGPGETHQRKRMREAMKKGAEPAPMAEGEVQMGRSAESCKTCHNKESPTFTPFCLKERMEKIEHLDPRKKRSKEDLAKLRGTCTPDCSICKSKEKDGDGK